MRLCGEGKIGAIDERARRTIAPLVDRRAHLQSQSTRGAIDERARWTIAPLVDRRQSLFFLSLSLRSGLSLLSLFLSLFGNDLN